MGSPVLAQPQTCLVILLAQNLFSYGHGQNSPLQSLPALLSKGTDPGQLMSPFSSLQDVEGT